jgi:hydroxypyruvate isomerase
VPARHLRLVLLRDADGHEHEGELGSAAIRRRTPEFRTKVAVMQCAIAITRYAYLPET